MRHLKEKLDENVPRRAVLFIDVSVYLNSVMSNLS